MLWYWNLLDQGEGWNSFTTQYSYSVQVIIINLNEITSNVFQCLFCHKNDSIERSVGNGRFCLEDSEGNWHGLPAQRKKRIAANSKFTFLKLKVHVYLLEMKCRLQTLVFVYFTGPKSVR